MNAAAEMNDATHMAREVAEIPAAIARCLEQGSSAMKAAADALKAQGPDFLLTIARGSSDHAASFLNYAAQIHFGVPVMSFSPSIVSIYDADIAVSRGAALVISQSGESPDLLAATRKAQSAGAPTLALTNSPQSQLAGLASQTIDIAAGPEKSVAATKSFVNSIVAGLGVLAEWQDDSGLRLALRALPEQASAALDCDWASLIDAVAGSESLYVLGRGPGFSIASEAALKFKETSGLHAEAYSAAEVMHGPLALVDPGFDVLVLAARDAALESTRKAVARLVAQGADVHVTDDQVPGAHALSHLATGHPLTDALLLIVPFYAFVEKLARRRGFNPDHPPHLKKVTETR